VDAGIELGMELSRLKLLKPESKNRQESPIFSKNNAPHAFSDTLDHAKNPVPISVFCL
jgi:hypothetical protein